MNYTLHQLKVFLTICRLRSVTKAAEELHLTQPAVSIQLKRLQEQFEIPLTEVIGRQLYVTDFGERIAEASKRILTEAQSIPDIINEYKGIMTGKIMISVVSTGKYVMPYFLNSFMKEYPNVQIVIDVTNKNKVIESLSNNETDFALVSILPKDLNVETIELLENKLYLVGSMEQEALKKKKLTPKELPNLPLIYREKGSATRYTMEQYLNQYNVKPMKSMVLVSNEAVKQAVSAGLGFSIMPLIGLRHELDKDIAIYPTSGLPIITTWNLIYNAGKSQTPALKAFIDYIKSTKEEVVEKHFGWTQKL